MTLIEVVLACALLSLVVTASVAVIGGLRRALDEEEGDADGGGAAQPVEAVLAGRLLTGEVEQGPDGVVVRWNLDAWVEGKGEAQ